jgi:ribonucrease Y
MANVLLFSILAALAGLGGGAVLSGFVFKNKQSKQIGETKEKIKSMLREAELTAETIKKDRMLEAKEKFFKLKAEFDEETNNKKNLIITNENKVKQLQQQVAKEQENVK